MHLKKTNDAEAEIKTALKRIDILLKKINGNNKKQYDLNYELI